MIATVRAGCRECELCQALNAFDRDDPLSVLAVLTSLEAAVTGSHQSDLEGEAAGMVQPKS